MRTIYAAPSGAEKVGLSSKPTTQMVVDLKSWLVSELLTKVG